MDENKDETQPEEVTTENKTEEVEEVDETKEDEKPEETETEDEDKDEQQDDNEESEAEESDGLTEEERTYFNNKIIELDRQLFEIKQQEKQKEVERKMKDRKYTAQQIERYSGMIDKNDMDKSITQLTNDIPPRNHKYVDPSLNNAARQKVSGNPKNQLHEIGRAMAKYMKGRKGRK